MNPDPKRSLTAAAEHKPQRTDFEIQSHVRNLFATYTYAPSPLLTGRETCNDGETCYNVHSRHVHRLLSSLLVFNSHSHPYHASEPSQARTDSASSQASQVARVGTCQKINATGRSLPPPGPPPAARALQKRQHAPTCKAQSPAKTVPSAVTTAATGLRKMD